MNYRIFNGYDFVASYPTMEEASKRFEQLIKDKKYYALRLEFEDSKYNPKPSKYHTSIAELIYTIEDLEYWLQYKFNLNDEIDLTEEIYKNLTKFDYYSYLFDEDDPYRMRLNDMYEYDENFKKAVDKLVKKSKIEDL